MIAYIDTYRDQFGVELICRTLGATDGGFLTSRGYRAAKARPASDREIRDAQLLAVIRQIHTDNYGVYGARKIWHAMRRQGWDIGRDRCARLMRKAGLSGVVRGRKPRTTTPTNIPDERPDLVERRFAADRPNRLWVADLTRLVTGEGVLWLGSVRDAFANRVVGWATGERATTALVLAALDHALRSRSVRSGELIFHSDKGAQYTALRFTQRLVDAGVAPSTGSTGDSYDNALAENLWSTLKVELVYWPGTTFATRAEAEHALLRYIDGWYNPRRIQAGLGGLSPDEYEDAYHRAQRDDHR